MTDSKPYLIRAMHEWISDNALTPYLYVDTSHSGLVLPTHLYEESPLVLNVSLSACNNLMLNNDDITFQARFGGQVFDIYLPMSCIIGIIARENGQGLTFDVESQLEPDSDMPEDEQEVHSDRSDKGDKQRRRGLKVVK